MAQSFICLKYILLIMLLQLSHLFSPLNPPLLCAPPPTSTPPPQFMSMGYTYKFCGFSISYAILNFPLFCAYQLCFLFPVPFPPFSLLPLPTDNPPCDLHFSTSVPVLVICLVCFCFLGSVVDSCYFTVHSFDHLLSLTEVPLTFHKIRAL